MKTIKEKQQTLKQQILKNQEAIKTMQKETAAMQKEYEKLNEATTLLGISEGERLEAVTVPVLFDGGESSTKQLKNEVIKQEMFDEEERAKKYYVIFNGPNQGIFDDWNKAAIFITGKKGIIHSKYLSLTEAKKALEDHKNKETYAQKITSPIQPSKGAIPLDRKIPVIGRIPQPRNLTISGIQSKQQIEDNCRLVKRIFDEEYNFLIKYTEEDKATSIYPIDTSYQGPKAVVLPEADPIKTYMLFQAGLISCIYFKGTSLFQYFPIKMKTALSIYTNKILDKKEGFLRVFGTIPEFNEHGEVTQSAIQLCQIGTSNHNYPAIGKGVHINELEHFGNNYALILNKCIKIQGRINYSASSTIIWSHQAKDPSELDIKLLTDFMTKLMKNQFNFSTEIKEYICSRLYQEFLEDHTCSICEASSGEIEIIQENVSNDDNQQ